MKKLNELFDVDSDINIYSIHSDSREVKQNSIFFCIEGLSVDGHQYVDDVIFQGARCIVHNKELSDYKKGIVYLKVEDPLGELNRVANVFYDFPSKKMKVIGVTGTNGKTVVASMLKDVLSSSYNTGYVGTISLEYDKVKLKCPYTTPETIFLQKQLYQMQKKNVEVVAMEASSHGLSLRRVESIHFDIGILTNIYEEHLDFHGTIDQYIASKQKLFNMLDESGFAILNKDDSCYEIFEQSTTANIITYAINNEADIMAKNIRLELNKTFFELHLRDNVYYVQIPLISEANVYNILATIAALVALKMDDKTIIELISKVKQIDGRMEVVEGIKDFTVIIDYCQHNRNYEDIFKFANAIKNKQGHVIGVIGAPGKRNIKNRKVIGELANKYLDHVILTEIDDRDENVEDICETIQMELKDTNSVIIVNRQIAIEQAIELACKDDIILILGKGHEKFITLSVGEADYPGDRVIVKEAMQRLRESEEEEDVI